MKNYKTDSKLVIDSSTLLLKEEREFLLKETKKVFQRKDEAVFIDTLFYNLLRNKPLFTGVEKIRADKYHINYYYPDFSITMKGREAWYLELIQKFEKKEIKSLENSDPSRIKTILKRIYLEVKNNYKKESKNEK